MEFCLRTRSCLSWSAASIGALSVLVGLVPITAAKSQKPVPEKLAAEVRASLAKSRPILLDKLARAHGGELALLCLAAVHDGVPVTDKRFLKAIKNLSRSRLGRTYDLSLRLMVASEFPGLPNRNARVHTDTRRILRAIYRGQGFGYDSTPKGWDLSNTQYGALGLRAAASMGEKIPAKVWVGLLRSTLSAQHKENGGFAYREGGRNPTVSMTAAGIAVLRLCRDHLEDRDVAEFEIPKRLAAAWEFLAQHKGEIGDPDTRNSFYFHYGLERASILSDVHEIDGKDWYQAGAEMLVRAQLPRGGWRSRRDHIQGGPDADGSDAVSTSFAILFLRRKFQKILAPTTPSGGLVIAQLSAQASADQIARAAATAVRVGRQAIPGVLRALRSQIKTRRIAAARAIIGITGEDFGFNPHVAPEKSGSAATRAELWWLKSKREAEPKPAGDGGGRGK